MHHLAVALALAAVIAGALMVQEAAEAQPTIPRAVGAHPGGGQPNGAVVPAGFVGLSIEYRSAPDYFGIDPGRPNRLFLSLVRRLTPGQSPVLRFGGDTTDWTWWPTPGVARSGGIRYALGRRWAAGDRASDHRR